MSKNKALIVVLAILFVHVMMTLAWHDRPFRPDESWTVIAGMLNSPREVMEYIALYDYAALPAPWLTIQGITHFVGYHEVPVRYVQFLFVVLGLSFLYQLGRLLYSHRIGVMAVLLAGMTPIFIAHAAEARSYSILFFATTGLMLFFQRWLKYERATDVLAYVLIGIYGVYSHQFVVFLIMMQFAYFVLFVRYDVGLFVRAVVMFGYVALALILGWGLVFAHVYVTLPNGITYIIREDNLQRYFLNVFSTQLTSPLVANMGIVLLGVLIPSKREMTKHRFPRVNGGLYLAVMAFGTFFFVWYLNEAVIQILTDRNLLTLVPALALLSANFLSYVMDKIDDMIPRFFVYGIVAILVVLATDWHTIQWSYNIFDMQAVEDIIEQDDAEPIGFMILPSNTWLGSSLVYQLLVHFDIDSEHIFIVSDDSLIRNLVRMKHSYHLSEVTDDTLDGFLGQYDTIIKIRWSRDPAENLVNDVLSRHYYLAKSVLWDDDDKAVEYYRQVPDDMGVDVQLGVFELIEWSIQGGVETTACSTVRLESVWQASDVPDASYSLSLTMVDANGQFVAQSDEVLGNQMESAWEPDVLRFDSRVLSIPCDTPAGSYPITFGVYDPVSMESLSTLDGDGNPTNQTFYYLTNIVVK